MSVEWGSVADFVSLDQITGEVVLTLSDHLEWGSDQHLLLLQQRLTHTSALSKVKRFSMHTPTRQAKACGSTRSASIYLISMLCVSSLAFARLSRKRASASATATAYLQPISYSPAPLDMLMCVIPDPHAA